MGTLTSYNLFSSVFGEEKNPYGLNPNAKGSVGISAEPPDSNKKFGELNAPANTQLYNAAPPGSDYSMPSNIYDKFLKNAINSSITGGYIPKLPGTEFGGFSNISQVASHAGTNIGSRDGDSNSYAKYFGGK